MNTTTQTTTLGSSSGGFLEPDMACLLKMTNDLVMKIKLQVQEMS